MKFKIKGAVEEKPEPTLEWRLRVGPGGELRLLAGDILVMIITTNGHTSVYEILGKRPSSACHLEINLDGILARVGK